MDLISPITITNSMLTSASVAEDDLYIAWNVATAYVVGNRVYLTSTHLIYECLISHTGTSPDTSIAPVASPKWLVYGYTNKYRALDSKWGTQTVAANTLTYTLTPGESIDSLGLINLLGETVRVQQVVNGLTKYDETFTLQTDVGVIDWRTYFIAPIVAQDDLVVNGLYPYYQQVITITITGPGQVGIGNVTMGYKIDIGRLMYNPTIGIIDYSKKTVDDYGNIEITERAYSKKFTCNLAIDTDSVDQVAAILAAVRAKPCLWVGAGSTFSSLIVWGFLKDFEVDLATPSLSYCSLTIEGLV